MGEERWSVSDSRSVRSPWVWRGFLVMSLFALGIVILLLGYRRDAYAAWWGVIAVGWFATAMWLWRQHSRTLR